MAVHNTSVACENRYRQRCPPRMSLQSNRYQPYNRYCPQPSPASQECINTLLNMNHRVSDEGFYVASPTMAPPASSFSYDLHNNINWEQNNFTTMDSKLHLPPCSPLTPSCAYYKTDTPAFTYPEDLLPPTSIFTASLARGLMDEENYSDMNTSFGTRAHDISSILSLPEQKCEVKSYDLFDTVVIPQEVYQRPQEVYQRPVISFLPYTNTAQMVDEKKVKIESSILPVTKQQVKSSNSKDKIKRQHECVYCGKMFKQRSTLTTHIRIHTGERPFNCHYCAKSFSDNSTYVKHLRIHTLEKPYSCTICGRSFAQSGNLSRHKKTHVL